MQNSLKFGAVVKRKGVVFLQDNARPHTSESTLKKIRDLGWTLLPHPSYSPDLAPSEYHLFGSLQNFLNGQKFVSLEEVEKGVRAFFVPKDPPFFKRGIHNLMQRWKTVIANGGAYFQDCSKLRFLVNQVLLDTSKAGRTFAHT